MKKPMPFGKKSKDDCAMPSKMPMKGAKPFKHGGMVKKGKKGC